MGDDGLFDFDEFDLEDTPQSNPETGCWQFSDAWRFDVHGDDSLVSMTVGHMPDSEGFGIALCSKLDSVTQSSLQLLLQEIREEPKAIFVEGDPYVALLKRDLEEQCWRVEYGRAQHLLANRPQGKQLVRFSNKEHTTFWLALHTHADRRIHVEMGLNSFPDDRFLITRFDKRTPPFIHFGLASLNINHGTLLQEERHPEKIELGEKTSSPPEQKTLKQKVDEAIRSVIKELEEKKAAVKHDEADCAHTSKSGLRDGIAAYDVKLQRGLCLYPGHDGTHPYKYSERVCRLIKKLEEQPLWSAEILEALGFALEPEWRVEKHLALLTDKSDEHIVAWASFEELASWWQLHMIWVAPELRGRGFGRYIMCYVESAIKFPENSRQVPRELRLTALDGSLGFYEKLGFEVAGMNCHKDLTNMEATGHYKGFTEVHLATRLCGSSDLRLHILQMSDEHEFQFIRPRR